MGLSGAYLVLFQEALVIVLHQSYMYVCSSKQKYFRGQFIATICRPWHGSSQKRIHKPYCSPQTQLIQRKLSYLSSILLVTYCSTFLFKQNDQLVKSLVREILLYLQRFFYYNSCYFHFSSLLEQKPCESTYSDDDDLFF